MIILHGQTDMLLVPAETEKMFGNSYGNLFYPNSNVQLVYASSEFAAAPTDVLTITEIAFRAEETRAAMDRVLESLSLRMNVFPGSMSEVVERKNALVHT